MSAPNLLRGAWLEPGHTDYEAARPGFNRRSDARPAVIARCLGVADVVAAVAYAREHALPIDVRSTGYAVGVPQAGHGVLIDLSPMRGVHVMPEQRKALIQGGVRGGDLQIEAGRHALAGATGALAGTGVGLMLGGGIGNLSPRVGWAVDNVLSIEMVTARGEVVVASPDRNPALYWAARGAPGTFGVVTALEVALHEIPPVVHAGSVSWSFENMDSAIRALRASWEWSDDFSLVPFISGSSPESPAGLELIACHSGPATEARADLERLRTIAPPDAWSVEPMPFADLHFKFDDWWQPMRNTTVQQPVTDLGDDLVEALVAKLRGPAGGGARLVEIIPLRGALGRAPALPSAFRENAEPPTWSLITGSWWEDPSEDEVQQEWVTDVVATIQQIGPAVERRDPSTVGVPLDPDAVARMYGDRFDRLREQKRRWDPDNVFPGAHEIPMADG